MNPTNTDAVPARLKTRPGAARLAGTGLVVGLALAIGLVACAIHHDRASSSRPSSGVAEFRELVVFSRNAVNGTLDALDELTAAPDRKSFEAFAQSIHRIEVDSIKVRARSQAMEARGDAYFAQWQERLAGMQNDAARQQAEQRREELKRSFDLIFQSTRGTRRTFDTFLAGLRHLRAKLELNPDLAAVNSARTLIAETERSGHQVQEGLADILAELNSLAAQLEPVNVAEQKQP